MNYFYLKRGRGATTYTLCQTPTSKRAAEKYPGYITRTLRWRHKGNLVMVCPRFLALTITFVNWEWPMTAVK